MSYEQDLQQLCVSLVGRTEGNLHVAVSGRAKTYNSSTRNATIEYNPFYLDYICDIFKVSSKSLWSKTRKREVVHARFMCYWYLYNSTELTLSAIGKMFNRDHATVLHGLKKDEEWTDIKDKIHLRLKEEFNSKIEKI